MFAIGLDYAGREGASNMDVDSTDWGADSVIPPIPPGEEGVLSSHAGGEAELCQTLLEDKRYVCVNISRLS